MRTILNKIIFGALFIFLSWKGCDGLVINIMHGSTDIYKIRELEMSEETGLRNLEILNGVPLKDKFIYYESDPYSPVDIVYPLISKTQAEKLSKQEPITIKVLVKLDNQSRSCLIYGDCISDNGDAIKGLVQVGLDNLGSGSFENIESEFMNLDENVLVVSPQEEPIDWYWNLVMLVVGTTFGYAILKSFFRRASSLSEYWDKITEKEMS